MHAGKMKQIKFCGHIFLAFPSCSKRQKSFGAVEGKVEDNIVQQVPQKFTFSPGHRNRRNVISCVDVVSASKNNLLHSCMHLKRDSVSVD